MMLHARFTALVRLAVMVGCVSTVGSSMGSCASDGRAPASVQTDSGGVAIVTNRRPAWPAGMEWRISDTPIVRIAGGRRQLVEVISAVSLRDGRIAVATASDQQIRLFSAAGEEQWAMGGSGSGPGQFRGVSRIVEFAADSLLVSDPPQRRLTVLSSTGQLVRLTPPPIEGGSPVYPLGLCCDRHVWALQSRASDTALRTGPTHRRLQSAIVLVDLATGAPSTTVGVFPSFEQIAAQADVGSRFYPAPFGRGISVGVGGRYLYVGTQDEFSVRQYSSEGSLLRLIRYPIQARRVTSAHIDAYLRSDAATQFRPPRESFPTVMPPYGRIVGDVQGSVWVFPYDDPAVTESDRSAWVCDSTGTLQGAVRLPTRLRVLAVEDDHVLGVWSDSLGREEVRRYTLNRGLQVSDTRVP